MVLILERVPTRLRGELSRWLIEPHPGLFVGSVSGMVRDKLWEETKKALGEGGATLAYNSNTEQGFAVRTPGKMRREIAEFEGLRLVCLPVDEEAKGKRRASRGATKAHEEDGGGEAV